jgi:ferric-dicitrate binding protein FerR (iron transport regulator)
MEEAKTTHWDLIAKYLRGESSSEEKEQLFEWLNKHPDNRELFNQLSSLWNTTGWEGIDTAQAFQPDADLAWQKFRTRVNIVEASDPVAAGPEVQAPEPRVIPLRRESYPWLRLGTRIAASVLLVMGLVFWLKFYFADNPPATISQSTKEEKRMIYLPDSSKVYLNRHSEISYVASFEDGKRIVNLSGEAFFEVRKDAGKPFIIYSQNAQTEVLGTSFNVRAYEKEGTVEVMVVTGKVAFSKRTGKGAPGESPPKVYLTPGFRAELASKGTLSKTAMDNPNGMAWRNEKLVFSNTQLSVVVESLQRYFQVPIAVENPQLLDCRFTGTFEQPELDQILEVLKVSVNLNYTAQGEAYVLSGQGCRK